MNAAAEKNGGRIVWMDLARSLAILLVVLCHSIENVYSMELESLELSGQSEMFRVAAFTLSRCGVPVFIYLSGSLLLTKKIETDRDCAKFYRHNLARLLISAEIWNVIYWIVLTKSSNIAYGGEGGTAGDLLKTVLFVRYVSFPHMWYMPMIVGMYLFVPFVAIIIHRISLKTLLLPLSVSAVMIFVVPFVSMTLSELSDGQITGISSVMDVSFSGGCYGIYFILGYYIGTRQILHKTKTGYLILGFVLSFVGTCLYQQLEFTLGNAYNVWYDFGGLLLCSALLYAILSRITIQKGVFSKALRSISKMSLGVFYVHVLVINAVWAVTDISAWRINKPLTVIVLCGMVFVLSLAVVWLLCRIPWVKRYVFMAG